MKLQIGVTCTLPDDLQKEILFLGGEHQTTAAELLVGYIQRKYGHKMRYETAHEHIDQFLLDMKCKLKRKGFNVRRKS